MGNLTVERLRQVLDYDPQTGAFTWKTTLSSHALAGTVAGRVHPSYGYRYIGIDGVKYRAHRLAWMHSHGVPPASSIDHRNGERDDNRLDNLRAVTHAVNQQNQRKAHRSNKSSGLLGVCWEASRGKWRAQISIDGKNRYLGRRDSAEAAHALYMSAKRELHEGCTV